jgi:magnesium transporter
VEENQAHLFLIFQMISAQFEKGVSIQTEQVSMFVFENTVVTIQEGKAGDIWEEVRDGLNNPNSRLRKENSEQHFSFLFFFNFLSQLIFSSIFFSSTVEFLVYTLLDSIVDILQDTISRFGTMLEDVEQDLFDDPLNERKYAVCRSVNRDLLLIRRLSNPLVQMVDKMIAPMEQSRWNLKEDAKQYHFSQQSRDYLRDVGENLARIVDLLATYKEICVSLDNLHTSAQEHRMNRTMYTLAVVSTIFLPLTFAAGSLTFFLSLSLSLQRKCFCLVWF